ncbi:MAG TPA: ComEA family DNA-binding protein [Actinobacteria bacterium]|nr:ComEA family DNA-binding protein [Actinomycetota bacterium]
MPFPIVDPLIQWFTDHDLDLMIDNKETGIRERLSQYGVSRGQALVWAAVGVVIMLLGGNYLYGHLGRGGTGGGDALEASIELGAVTKTLDDPATVSGESGPVIVHVAGSVAMPGVYELVEGDRAADAIERAGGALPEADLDRVNLASVVSDGQQLFVPAQGEPIPAASGGTQGVGAAAGGPEQLININTAGAEQLQQLDGVGEKTAQKIIAYRQEVGGFSSVEELMEVPGIGPAKFEGMKDKVRV